MSIRPALPVLIALDIAHSASKPIEVRNENKIMYSLEITKNSRNAFTVNRTTYLWHGNPVLYRLSRTNSIMLSFGYLVLSNNKPNPNNSKVWKGHTKLPQWSYQILIYNSYVYILWWFCMIVMLLCMCSLCLYVCLCPSKEEERLCRSLWGRTNNHFSGICSVTIRGE